MVVKLKFYSKTIQKFRKSFDSKAKVEMWTKLLFILLELLVFATVTSERIVLCEKEYKVTGLLGKGGQGRVYKAIGTNTRVAIKVVPIEPNARKFVDNEVRIHSAVARLPNIVSLFCTEEIQSNMYFVMEYCSGGALNDYITSHSHSRHDRAEWISQLAKGIQSLLSLNVVHRDLKPENCLICSNGELKISDFGFAQYLKPGYQFIKDFPATSRYAVSVFGHESSTAYLVGS